MTLRDVCLKMEPVFDYHPVPWRRECMRNTGHEDATIPLSEVHVRPTTALVYREYLEAAYQIPSLTRSSWPTITSLRIITACQAQ